MPWFSSDRERRLWAWTAAVVLAIYATLPLAQSLVGVLRSVGLLDLVNTALVGVFLLGMLMVAATVVTQGLRVRPAGIEVGAVLGILVAYMMIFVRMALVTERSHLIEYSVVAVFIAEALTERRSQGRRVPAPGVLALVATCLIGALDECIQLVLPNRVFDPEDILFNSLAAAMALASLAVLRWVRRAARPSTGRESPNAEME